MPSLKLDKFMARLYARAGNATVTLNRNDLEVLNQLIQSEVTRYEADIQRLTESVVRTRGGAIAYGGSTEASSQASSSPTQTTATGSPSPQRGIGGVGYTPPEE